MKIMRKMYRVFAVGATSARSTLLVLHKPVPSGKLRAAIANLMHKAEPA